MKKFFEWCFPSPPKGCALRKLDHSEDAQQKKKHCLMMEALALIIAFWVLRSPMMLAISIMMLTPIFLFGVLLAYGTLYHDSPLSDTWFMLLLSSSISGPFYILIAYLYPLFPAVKMFFLVLLHFLIAVICYVAGYRVGLRTECTPAPALEKRSNPIMRKILIAFAAISGGKFADLFGLKISIVVLFFAPMLIYYFSARTLVRYRVLAQRNTERLYSEGTENQV